jgi:predicted nucleic acid-binding protein
LIAAFDASTLVYVIDEHAKPPIDPATGKPLDRCHERVMHLLESLQQENIKIVIPTPALAEVLVRAAKGGPEFLRILSSSKHFRIAPFDERAAVEFAARQAERIAANERAPASTRAKAKFDDQIVAIAAVEGATMIYSDDEDIAKLAEGRFAVIKIAAITLPPEAAQGKLPFETGEQDGPNSQS